MNLCDNCGKYAPLVLWAYTYGFCEVCEKTAEVRRRIEALELRFYNPMHDNSFLEKLAVFSGRDNG